MVVVMVVVVVGVAAVVVVILGRHGRNPKLGEWKDKTLIPPVG